MRINDPDTGKSSLVRIIPLADTLNAKGRGFSGMMNLSSDDVGNGPWTQGAGKWTATTMPMIQKQYAENKPREAESMKPGQDGEELRNYERPEQALRAGKQMAHQEQATSPTEMQRSTQPRP